ncbi:MULTISPECIES: lactonase family protein [Streptomyces]|uniref:Lactonase family protein n=1 Tax=Streptomyces chilikensis TaxID=1194079 RepID=A0ABV3EHM9_9ACTN|nr:lactonase family protein [Streptomyces sp. MJP52]MDH6228321.1 6-phosphogluconolactonase [Streptomyces sp. MJP52]
MTDGGARRPRAYIGSFTAAGGPGLVTADRDPATGALTLTGASDDLPDPSYLALSADGAVLYAVSETARGAVAAYRVTGDRPVRLGPPVPVGGSGPTHLSLFAGRVLTANYGSGSVSALRIRPDGAPHRTRAAVLAHTGSGPSGRRQQGPHAHQVQPDPDGRWAVSVDLGTDSVRICAVGDDGLRVHREVKLRPGSGPRHLAFHPDGDRAYVLNELTPTVTVCRWKSREGLLEPLRELGVLEGAVEGDAYPSGVVTSADGRFVWTATRGTDTISVLAVDGETLRLRGTVSCGGHWPRALTALGRFLYVANERSGDVTWFGTDPDTGLPERGGSVEVAAASCVVLG